jgi:RHS repeat-associated protein
MNQRYPGQYFDEESNLNYNYFRNYSAAMGRYSQPDPIGLDGGMNRFGYVGANPLMFTDPRGLQATLPGPGGLPIPIIPLPGAKSPAPPGWDPADGPAPGTGTIVWPSGFRPNPEPTSCRIEIPSSPPPLPPKNDCESQLKFCMNVANAVDSWFMKGSCLLQYAICKKVGQ